MARKASPRITRPSGVETSSNGKYFYWYCTVSGQETFAPEPRFNEVVKKYGSEEKLFKTFVLRPVQKYVDSGFDAETIKEIIKNNDGKLPPLDKKPFKDKSLKNERKQRLKRFSTTTVQSIEMNSDGNYEEVKVPVFPWSGNPDYFKSAPSVFNVADESKTACIYPNRQLNDACYGCTVYSVCQCSAKLGEADWKNTKRNEVKTKKLESFSS
jgi:hypothetical protein